MPAITLSVPRRPRLDVVVQIQTLLPPAAAVELYSFCAEPDLHRHHPLDVYRVTFDHAAVIIRVPHGLNERGRGDWAWAELGGLSPRPRFVSIEYLCEGWSDDRMRRKVEVGWRHDIGEAA